MSGMQELKKLVQEGKMFYFLYQRAIFPRKVPPLNHHVYISRKPIHIKMPLISKVIF